MATQKPTTGQGVFRTPRTIALDKGIGSKLEGPETDNLDTTCGVPEGAPGHAGHYNDNTEYGRMGGSTSPGPQQLVPFKLGGS